MKNYVVVFITAVSMQQAQKIANALVDKRLAACVNIIADIKSIYIWKGKKETANEVLLIAKSKKGNFKKIVKAVRALHSYEVPEIISLKIDDGCKEYLKWLGVNS
ncbi:MAG: divalent-cation tolerance protein CutA [Candidatus Omnitrophota bacterium]